jgi:hypothetical protein
MTTRSPLDVLVTYASLKRRVSGDLMDRITDEALASGDGAEQIKNVCAKVPVQLSDRIDDICTLLGISKRRFLEAAFTEAIKKAEEIMDAEGVEEHLVAMTEASPARMKAKADGKEVSK